MSIASCIILAAGKNSRLDTGKPKSLLEINGMTLLERHIRNFKMAGVRRFCIVTGHNPEPIRALVPSLAESYQVEIDLVHNERYDLENGFSISVTEGWVKEHVAGSFFLTMGDHAFQPDFVQVFVDKVTDREGDAKLFLAVDPPGDWNSHIDIEDVTKVNADGPGYILQIGKQIAEFNCYDTGLFCMSTEVFEVLDDCFSRDQYTISHMVSALIASRQARTVSLPGYPWNDVDNQEDLKNTLGLGLV